MAGTEPLNEEVSPSYCGAWRWSWRCRIRWSNKKIKKRDYFLLISNFGDGMYRACKSKYCGLYLKWPLARKSFYYPLFYYSLISSCKVSKAHYWRTYKCLSPINVDFWVLFAQDCWWNWKVLVLISWNNSLLKLRWKTLTRFGYFNAKFGQIPWPE